MIEGDARNPERLQPAIAFGRFFAGVVAMVVLRLAAAHIEIPNSLVFVVDVLLAALFLAIPIWSIAQAARGRWKPLSALGLTLLGVAIHGLAILAASRTGYALVGALGVIGLQIWCVGLGALLATLIREKNILIPVAIFLAVFDVFLVLSPNGFTQRIMKAAPHVLESVGHAIPMARTAQRAAAHATVAGYIGPADLVFLGAYLFALSRFGIPLRRTILALMVTLGLYLVFVLTTGIALPALLPIGAVTLAVNYREFKLSKDEWASTAVVVAIGVGLLTWSWLRRPGPQSASEPPSMPPATSQGRSPSQTPEPPASRPTTP